MFGPRKIPACKRAYSLYLQARHSRGELFMKTGFRADKIISCIDCGQDFVWTMGEQGFYEEKGLKEPVRCPMCRAVFASAKKDRFRGKVEKDI